MPLAQAAHYQHARAAVSECQHWDPAKGWLIQQGEGGECASLSAGYQQDQLAVLQRQH